MMYIKVPIKKKIREIIDVLVETKPELSEKRELLTRRWNSLLIVLVFPISVLSFSALVVISPFIFFSWQSAMMTGVFALCIYAFIEQISQSVTDERGE